LSRRVVLGVGINGNIAHIINRQAHGAKVAKPPCNDAGSAEGDCFILNVIFMVGGLAGCNYKNIFLLKPFYFIPVNKTGRKLRHPSAFASKLLLQRIPNRSWIS